MVRALVRKSIPDFVLRSEELPYSKAQYKRIHLQDTEINNRIVDLTEVLKVICMLL